MIVGTSTSCSTSSVTRRAARIGTPKGRILGTSITCSGSGESTRKNCTMSGNWSTICGTGTSSAGTERCPTTCRRTHPWGRGASGTWPCSASRAPSPGPCRLLALCAVVRGLGKGHCDAHPCILEVCTEASLSPAAGTACAAACVVACSHHQRRPPARATNTRQLSLK